MMYTKQKSDQGVMMAMVVILFTACIMLLTALLQVVTSTASFSNEVVYRQIALAAAKSALEAGKESFDDNINFDLLDTNGDSVVDNDTNTNGVPDPLEEKLLFQNSSYRVTYQLTIKPGGTSADSRSKTVTGTGRVYLPAGSSTARYSRVLNSEVVRSQIVSNNPSDYSPLAWYDASCGPSTNTDPSCVLPTVLKTGSANVSTNPISTREEQRSNGNHCGGAPNPSGTGISDGWLSMPRKGECGATVDQRVGILFNAGAGLAKDATLQDTRIQFTAAAADNFNPIVLRFRGIKLANAPVFTTANGTQVGTTTTAFVDWTSTVPNWPTAGASQIPTHQSPNLTPILQEIMAQAGWNTGNNIGFAIECQSGCTGSRRAMMNPITLNITYADYTEANNGDNVQVWRDRSGNGFHLTALSGAQPTRSTVSQLPAGNDIVGKPMVRFPYNPGATSPNPSPNTGKAMSASVPVGTGRTANSYTTFAVISFKKSIDDNLATHNGFVLSFRGAGTDNNAVIPYWRHPAGMLHSPSENGITADWMCQGGAVSSATPYERQCRYFNLTTRDADWTIVSNRSELNGVEALFRYHGNISGPQVYTFAPMQLNAPYTIALGYNPYNNIKAAGFDVSELIIYDRTLTCPQMESVEQYLADKWGYNDPDLYSTSQYVSEGCRENNIPAF